MNFFAAIHQSNTKMMQIQMWKVIIHVFLVIANTSSVVNGHGLPCDNDGECLKDEEYCLGGECAAYTVCSTDVDCYNPANRLDSLGGECDGGGYYECSFDGGDGGDPTPPPGHGNCVQVCGKGPCQDGSETVNCFSDPCKTETLCAKTNVAISCVANYCGGCNTIRFDEAGNEVCRIEDNNVTCQTTDDCANNVGTYCASNNICLKYYSCHNTTDCSNVNNLMTTEEFLVACSPDSGVECTCEDGLCGPYGTDGGGSDSPSEEDPNSGSYSIFLINYITFWIMLLLLSNLSIVLL